jgi:hypothetical protein
MQVDTLNSNLTTKNFSIFNGENNFQPLLDKPLFIKTFQWDSTLLSNANIPTGALSLPQDLLVNDVIAAPFQFSAFYTAKMCLRLQVLGTPFLQGALIIYFKPNNGFGTTITASSINDALVAPNVILFANQSTPACLEIPFSLPTNVGSTNFNLTDNYYNYNITRFSSNVGSIYAKVLTPLTSISATSVRISIHATFADVKFYVPKNGRMLPAPPVFSEDNAQLSRLQRLRRQNGVENVLLPPLQEVDENPTPKVNSFAKISEKFDEFDRQRELSQQINNQNSFKFEMLETLAYAALPSMADFLKDGVDRVKRKIFTTVGLDKPTQPLVSEQHRMTTSTNYNHTEGVLPLDRMTMHTSHITTADANSFPANYDEMDMANILRKEQFIANFIARSSDAVGKMLFTCPMSPMCVPLVLGTNSGVPLITRFYMLTKYWKGTLNLHIKMSMTDMQTAKIMVVKAYNIGRFTGYPSITDVSNFDTETYELNKGGQEIIVPINYNALNELNFNNMDYLSGTLQHGQIFIYLIQPVQNPVSAANFITGSVFISAGDDFSFYGPAEYAFSRPLSLINEAALREEITVEKVSDNVDFKFETLERGVNVTNNVDDMPAKRVSFDTDEVKYGNQTSGKEQTTIPSTVPSVSTNTQAPAFVPHRTNHNMAPIRHIRDILRRYTQFYAYTANDVTEIAVSDLFRYLKYSSIFNNVTDFYHAFKGGLRFRILLPDLLAGAKVKAYYRYPTVSTAYASPQTYGTTALVPGRVLTASSFTYVYDVVDLNGPAYTPLLITVNQMDSHLDFEITCESPFKWHNIHQIQSLAVENDIAVDLGKLLIAFPTEYVGKKVEMFVSLADEARVGILAYNSPIYIHAPAVNTDFQGAVPTAVKPFFFAAT